MHQQMLARYDAEREGWDLDPVVPYDFDEREVRPHTRTYTHTHTHTQALKHARTHNFDER